MALHRRDKSTWVRREKIKGSVMTWDRGIEMEISLDSECGRFPAHCEAVADRHEANFRRKISQPSLSNAAMRC
jgi:hypothetical protein